MRFNSVDLICTHGDIDLIYLLIRSWVIGSTFAVYAITRSAPIFGHSPGLLSFHLGSVALLGVEISRVRKNWLAAGYSSSILVAL